MLTPKRKRERERERERERQTDREKKINRFSKAILETYMYK